MRIFESFIDFILEMEYEKAIDKNDEQAVAAQEIGTKQLIAPFALYDWANRHKVDLVKNFDILIHPDYTNKLTVDIYRGKLSNMKYAIKK
jgi:hypothetical protein